MSRRFPWADLLGFAVAGLGLSPQQAWAATPREISMAGGWLGAAGRDGASIEPPRREDLEALMARYPDAATVRNVTRRDHRGNE